MYRVMNKNFSTFEDLVDWIWNEDMIEFNGELDVLTLSEEEKQEACEELSKILASEE